MANPGTPTLISPISGVQITDSTPTLSFTIPSDSDNDDLIFQVELDTHNPLQTASSDYLKLESRFGVGSWQYDTGSGFNDVPTGGIGTTAYNKTGTVTVPVAEALRNDIWYWKISVSDQLTTGLFGTTSTFGCRKFG